MISLPRDPTVTPRKSGSTLTPAAIRALRPGQELKDDRIPGLSVRRRRHSISFMLYYRTRQGRQRRPKIGPFPTLTIAEAREIARAMLVRVAAGQDPSAQDAKAKHEPTVADLWERVEQEHYNRGKGWDKEAKRLYTRHIKPKYARTKVRHFCYDDAKAIHVALKDTPTEANQAIAVLSKMLSLAEKFGPERRKWRPMNSNPCHGVDRYRIAKRRRYAKPHEIAKIGPILERYAQIPRHLTGVAVIYLLIFSGARPSEILWATPNQLERIERDGQVMGVLRLEEAKTGPRDVFLPPQAMAVLDRLPKSRARLAGRRTMPRKLWGKIRTEAGCPDLWARDWRRTFATVALSNGVSLGKVGELLGHASANTTKIYALLLEEEAHAAAAVAASKLQTALMGRPEGGA